MIKSFKKIRLKNFTIWLKSAGNNALKIRYEKIYILLIIFCLQYIIKT